MMNRRGLLLLVFIYVAFGLLCWFSGPAKAAEGPSEPAMTYTCEDIRRAVALFESREAAIRAARAAGATDQQIEQARRCLDNGASVGS